MTDEPKPEPTPESEDERLARLLGELDESNRATFDEARRQVSEADDEFEERLAKLEKKASDAKQVREAKEKETDRRLASERESARGAGVGLQVAYMIMGVPLLFAGIGWLIDRWQGTGVFVGVGTLVGAVLGIVMTIYTLNKTNS